MAINEIRNLSFSSGRAKQHRYQFVDATEAGSALERQMIGRYISGANQGKIALYDPNDIASGMRFLGFLNGDPYQDDPNASEWFGEVDIQGLTLREASVTGSASSKPGDPVYANDLDPLDNLSITPEHIGQEAVAVLHEQLASSSTTWTIVFKPGQSDDVPGTGGMPKVTAYTADGPITLPVEDGEAARLTGASSAAMTLAAPADTFIGKKFTIYREAGTGTHDVDYTGEGTGSVTRVLADGEATTLLAVRNAIGANAWRPLS